MTMPHDISAEGWRIDWLIDVTSIFVSIVAAFFVAWLVIALWRGSRRTEATPLPSPRRQMIMPLIIAAFILVVVDGTLFVRSTLDLHGTFLGSADALERPGAVRVEISGQQWAWNIRYAGPDGLFATADDPVTTNELVVPVGAPVVIELASADVVHALNIPAVRRKYDAIPGRIARLWFEARELGTYDIACAQFCGTAHYKMLGVMRVVRPGEFESWIAKASADSLAIAEEDARSRDDEPSRRKLPGVWPTIEKPPFGRDWGWAWGTQPGSHDDQPGATP